MATTTNYGWDTPDDTDLVKDGAAAIRTLGSSVDTTTKALNPSTTLGDVEYRSATANTNTRLGIGTTGQVLTVSGGVPAWATASSGGMTLLSTTTLSGATTTLSSIPQTYNSLYIVVTGITANTANNRLRFLPNNSAILSDTTFVEGTTTTQLLASVIRITQSDTLRTDANNAFAFTINNYTSSTSFKPLSWYGRYFRSTSVAETISGWGSFSSNTAVTSMVIDYGGTNTFIGGTVLLYGVK